MKFLINTTKILIIPISVLLLFSCSKNKAEIPEKTMSKIIAEMYITDQYIETCDKLKFGIDSLSIYTPIIKKYGYTIEDYYSSTSFYLAKGNTYKKIFTRASKILKERASELEEIAAINNNNFKYLNWSLIDTVNRISVDKLYKYPYLRMVRLFVLKDKNIKTTPADTSEMDIPGNILWWRNNLRLIKDTSSFYNINQYYKTDFYKNKNYSKPNSFNIKKPIIDTTNVNIPKK